VAEPDQLKPPVVLQRFVEVEDEVARDAEDLADAGAPELIEEIRVERHARVGLLG
jgi:hypothetical protein